MAEKKFYGFEKIPEKLDSFQYPEAFLKKIYQLKWVATEKIHGANFSMSISTEGIQYHKRKESLSWEDDFFGFQLAVEKNTKHLYRLFELCNTEFSLDTLLVYGELFGGHYPHPEVKADLRVQAIQTGIYYSPQIEFCAFDLAFVQNGKKTYVDYEKAIPLFEQSGIFYAQPLLIGNLNEALNYPIEQNSTIPSRLGLPLLKENMMEGIVIKPLKIPLPLMESGIERPVIKLKNKKFKESDEYDQSIAWSFQHLAQKEEVDWIIPELLSFLNQNRLQSAISKIGALDKSNLQRMQQIKELLLEDILEAFEENNPRFLKELSPMALEEIQFRLKQKIEKMLEEQ